ncbi:uncharacterized protein [Pyrus communis]|uniref:uncharacterized protein n=1 Tax=Pyrus communis TaxID=23211 RepID=UPI0035C0EA5D
MEGSDAGIYGIHPHAPRDLKLPGFVPGFLSQSTIVGVYGVSSLRFSHLALLRDKDQLPYALVTFVQPYAFQTALLLDDATLGGQPIGILPAYDIRIPIVSDEDVKDDHTQNKNQLAFIPTANMLRKSPTANMLKKSKEEMEEKLKLSEKAGRVLMNQTRSAIYAVEQAAGRMGTALMNNN